MARIRSNHRIGVYVAKMDFLRLTVVYLRIWKLCDIQFYNDKQRESARVFDVIPIDAGRLERDLQEFLSSVALDPSWAEDPDELERDITTVLTIAQHKPISEKNLNILELLRKKAQDKALKYSGEIKIALGGGAGTPA